MTRTPRSGLSDGFPAMAWRQARRSSGFAALAVVACTFGCITDHGPIEWEKWRETYPEDYSLPLEEKARKIEAHLVALSCGQV